MLLKNFPFSKYDIASSNFKDFLFSVPFTALTSFSRIFTHQFYLSLDEQTYQNYSGYKNKHNYSTKINKTLLKALATGYRYKKAMESGISLSTLSKQDTYISRISMF